ncbi:VOC family protein [Streptomyces sp. ISL-12]|uniref:VOC family protein n=1 Tax=Streptomyces sp. ISL-12 TaxID=2819177 RepID=UPI001BE6E984|nr:VOC family protein [Streptomyces sp. ISL-12]MBT2415885.1 VOC family protein [Streptomyces sp. ISL-12]
MLTDRYVTGAPNWIDVATPDVAGAAAFYGGLFGWRLRPAPTGDHGYFERDGATVAGCLGIAPQQGPPSWTVYFRTADAEAAARSAERARGRVLVPPTPALEEGVTAVLADRAGAPYGVWQPGRRKGLDLVGDTGALCWAELYTPDIAAAAAHYHAVLGLETSALTFPGGAYTCVNPPGAVEEGMFGGVVPLADDPVETEAHWLPYIAVADTDEVVARARELGGEVRLPATDVGGAGRLARLADPYGARFAVLRPAPGAAGAD